MSDYLKRFYKNKMIRIINYATDYFKNNDILPSPKNEFLINPTESIFFLPFVLSCDLYLN